jgi:hypothetical protein
MISAIGDRFPAIGDEFFLSQNLSKEVAALTSQIHPQHELVVVIALLGPPADDGGGALNDRHLFSFWIGCGKKRSWVSTSWIVASL